MATFDVSSKSAGKQAAGDDDWTDAVPLSVDAEDTMSDKLKDKAWEKMYSLAGLAAAGEKERKALRAAVYTYGVVNATSRVGNYGGELHLATGKTVPASIIPQATGKHAIRRFFRANMRESYTFLKTTDVMAKYPRFLAKVASHGIAAENAFAVADWLTDCPAFTPAETKAHEMFFASSVERAKRARQGKTLETVEANAQENIMRAQGPMEDSGVPTSAW